MSRAALRSAACAVVVLFVLTGCSTSGLSPREVRGRDYSSYVYAMYRPADDRLAVPMVSRPLTTPARVAVAQIGEVAPPSEMLDRLRKNPAVFKSVEPVSGMTELVVTPPPPPGL